MDLTTRCPHCGTTFSASLEQLQLRKGYIRCINCANIFDGFDAVVPASGITATPASPATQSAASPPPAGAPVSGETASGQSASGQPAAPSAATAPAPPAVPTAPSAPTAPVAQPSQAVPPAEPTVAMPSVVRQRNAGRSAPAHTVTVPPQSPADRPGPAFTISADPARVGSPDQDPVFSVGDAVHIRADPPLGNVAPNSGRSGPSRPGHDTREPHIPLIPRSRNAAARVFVATPPEGRAPSHGPTRPSATPSQRPTASVYGEPRRAEPRRDGSESAASPSRRPAASVYVEPRRDDDTEAESRSGRADFLGPERPAYHGVVRAFWLVLIAVGLILLLAQLLYVYRAQIANNVPVLRPVLEKACEPLHCKVPYSRRIDLISIMSSSLRAVPSAGKASNAGKAQDAGKAKNAAKAKEAREPKDAAADSMVLQLTMRNQYDKPQEWPTLVLDLTDFSGTLVVRKNLPPQLYLPSEALQHPFAPTSEMTVSVPIAMNGQKINGYQLGKFFQ